MIEFVEINYIKEENNKYILSYRTSEPENCGCCYKDIDTEIEIPKKLFDLMVKHIPQY